MDNGGQQNTTSSNQNQTDLSVSLAASSMINESDKIPPNAYQANLKRIQAVKEIVRRLEMNNETAHKNFLMDELEKRVQEGREAEEMLTRFQNTQGLPDTIQFTNHLPNDKPDVVLPTTATLVEVPEARPSPSYSPPAVATAFPQTAQLPQSQRPPQPLGRDYSTPQPRFVHYVPHPVTQNLSSAPLQPRTPIDTQGRGNPSASGYATQAVPVSSIPTQHAFNGYQPTQPQQRPWKMHQPQAPGPQTMGAPYAPGYTIPVVAQDGSAGPSKPATYPQPGFPNHPVYQVPLSTVQNQFHTFPSRTESSQALQGAPGAPVRQASGQIATIQSRTQPTEPLSQPSHLSAASQQTPISQSARPQQLRQHLAQHPQPWPQQSLTPSLPAQQPPQFHSRQSVPQSLSTQQLPQSGSQQPPPLFLSTQQPPPPQFRSQQSLPQSLPATQHPRSQPRQYTHSVPPRQSLQSQSQQPLQLPFLPQQQHPLPGSSRQPASTVSSSASPVIPQLPPSRPLQVRDSQYVDVTSQIPHAKATQASGQGERSQHTLNPFADQATFVKYFQVVVQRGHEVVKAFWTHSISAGVDREWFEAAIRSVPRPVWEAIVAQAKQSGPSSENVAPRPSAVPHNVSATPGTSAPVVNAQPLPTSQPVQPTPSARPPNATFSIPTEIAHFVPGQPHIPYAIAAQMKYYSDEATRATLSAQGVNIPSAGPQSAPVPQTTTPERSAFQTQTSPRTPKEADRSTLARDILRSLGKPIPKPKETRSQSLNEVSNRGPEEGGPSLELTPSTTDPSGASPKPPTLVPSTTTAGLVVSPSMPPEKPAIPEAPQGVASPRSVSEAKLVPQEPPKPAAVIEGPIMIDLTIDDSDESVHESGQNPSFPIQEVAGVTTSHSVSPTNTTTYTPLLDSLSLEEAPVEVATAGETADVRMQSPSHLTVAEEDVESELLYPPLNDMESTSSSSNLPLKGATERPASSQLPLFLPSPPVSPTPSDRSRNTEPLEMDHEMNAARDENRLSLKRHSVEVDGMETDTDLVVRKRPKRAYVLVPPPPSPVKKLMMKMKERAVVEGIVSGCEDAEEYEELRYDPLERLLIEESKSQLLERRCRWSGCDAILNCGTSLLIHLTKHTLGESSQAPFVCLWGGCKRQFTTREERDIHLERHTIRPLPCPFTGCDEQFDEPIQLMQHEVQHQNEGHRQSLMRKPTYKPIVPSIPARLGRPPHRLPSHRVIPRRVIKSTISADRHAIMGPWVLWHIFSPVELGTRKQNAPMRGRPSRQISLEANADWHANHDYDFLLPISSYSTKTPQLDDLDSTVVTLDAARGLTIWGSGPDLNSLPRLATLGAPMIESAPPEVMAVTTKRTAETTTGGRDLDNHVAVLAREDSNVSHQEQLDGQVITTGEEEDVERMLVL